ncbi:MAG: hypothetical protein ACYTF0_04210 [Planctomycetota bacterium]|jgi:hypothetical protein
MARFLLIFIVVLIVATVIRRFADSRVQEQLRRMGNDLAARGVDFQQWLQHAGLNPSDLHDKQRKAEVQARLLSAGRELLRQG